MILHEKVKTTKAKAKAVRPLVEKYITAGKKGTLAVRRRMAADLGENASKKVLEVLAPRYEGRPGGYLRLVNLGQRQGDGAEIVQIEMV